MSEALLIGLLVPVMSGLAFVAYRHPVAYARWLPYLLAIEFVIGAALLLWSMAVLEATTTMTPYIELEKWKEARAATDALRPAGWLFYLFPAIWLYLLFLGDLHRILGLEEKPRKGITKGRG